MYPGGQQGVDAPEGVGWTIGAFGVGWDVVGASVVGEVVVGAETAIGASIIGVGDGSGAGSGILLEEQVEEAAMAWLTIADQDPPLSFCATPKKAPSLQP